jgi:amino acid transporter
MLAAGYYGIRTSARLGTVLGVFEIAVFVVLAVFLVIHAGSHNTLTVFTTRYTPSGFHGMSGVIAGSVFTILAFGGFEGAAPLAEEARDPGRTVQRAVLGATLGIGVLYLFTTYAAAVAFGPAKFSGFTGGGPASWEGMARSRYGIFWFFVFLAIVNSTIANANAGVNVSSRTAFAMGRIRAFPHFLAQVHHRHRSPVNAILTGTVVTIAVTLGLGLGYGPEVAFAMWAPAS